MANATKTERVIKLDKAFRQRAHPDGKTITVTHVESGNKASVPVRAMALASTILNALFGSAPEPSPAKSAKKDGKGKKNKPAKGKGKKPSRPDFAEDGATVMALYEDGEYYPATVTGATKSGLKVEWADGSGEGKVGFAEVVEAEDEAEEAFDVSSLEAGDTVMAKYDGGDEYEATVVKVLKNDVKLTWTEDDSEGKVPHADVVSQVESEGDDGEEAVDVSTLEAGDSINALFEDGEYYPATVVKVLKNDVKLTWDEDDSEGKVKHDQVRAGEASEEAEEADFDVKELEKGDAVMAKFDDGEFYPATVVKVTKKEVKLTWDEDDTKGAVSHDDVMAGESTEDDVEADGEIEDEW